MLNVTQNDLHFELIIHLKEELKSLSGGNVVRNEIILTLAKRLSNERYFYFEN